MKASQAVGSEPVAAKCSFCGGDAPQGAVWNLKDGSKLVMCKDCTFGDGVAQLGNFVADALLDVTGFPKTSVRNAAMQTFEKGFWKGIAIAGKRG